MARVLLVDDDIQALESTKKILDVAGHSVTVANDGQSALDCFRDRAERDPFDVVVTDVRMPRLGGMEFLRALSLRGDRVPVILMTAFGRVEDAVWAMKLGAVDFLTKPFKRQSLLSALDLALKRVKPQRETERELIGNSPAIFEMRAMIEQVAKTNATVLITGESGTGKELVAQQIHRRSPRAGAKFIPINCAAVPDQLIESELFGFEKGAFTGAMSARPGLFEAADGGTLLLDEIGDMPISLQAKLLRTLQEGEVRRLGATHSRRVDVRVIAATNRNLREAVRAGMFREDLLFRLEVISIQVPALRDRPEDIKETAGHFLGIAARRHEKLIQKLSDDVISALAMHPWPGNVRELSNVIERAVVFCDGPVIELSHLPPHLITTGGSGARAAGSAISVPLGTPLREVEDLLIRKTLEATDGDKTMTAKLLGINSRTIYRKLDSKDQR
jgi:two-component system response regulator HydG